MEGGAASKKGESSASSILLKLQPSQMKLLCGLRIYAIYISYMTASDDMTPIQLGFKPHECINDSGAIPAHPSSEPPTIQ